MDRAIAETRDDRGLRAAVLLFAACSLVHFIHNAEFLAEYPGLPRTWTRLGIYGAFAAVTAVGCVGWLLLRRGPRLLGLSLLAVYAALGLDSLGHYVLAPMSAHTAAMNGTILLEVTAAGLLLFEIGRRLVAMLPGRSSAVR